MRRSANEAWIMMERPGWMSALAQSLKVAALVMVLGYAILAAEQRLAQDVSLEEIVAVDTVVALVPASRSPARTDAAQAGQPARTASR